MSKYEIREPVQKRSIEKKEKIIESGFKLICEKGYHNTNTAEIAKDAGVSTGIIYQYFKDKHDIFIAGLDKYADNIFFPMLEIPLEDLNNNNLFEFVKKLIEKYIKNHKLSLSSHEEIMAMVHSDKEVAYYFYKRELNVTHEIVDILINNGFNDLDLEEKVHIVVGLIDNLCHEIVYHKHEEINYSKMTKLVINSIVDILK